MRRSGTACPASLGCWTAATEFPYPARRGAPGEVWKAEGRVSPAFRYFRCGLLRDDPDHLEALVRVAPLVVVPGDQLDEGVVQRDAGLGVEDRSARVAAEVGGDHLV